MSTKTLNNSVKVELKKEKKSTENKLVKRTLTKEEKNLLKGCSYE